MIAVTSRDLTTIRITGDIDAYNVDEVTAHVRDAVPRRRPLVVDLAGVDFIAVAGLRALLAMNIECARCGTPWALIAGTAASRLLRVGDPDHTLPAVGSALEALLKVRHGVAANRRLRAVTGR
jgi:anti-anti-sigma factor